MKHLTSLSLSLSLSLSVSLMVDTHIIDTSLITYMVIRLSVSVKTLIYLSSLSLSLSKAFLHSIERREETVKVFTLAPVSVPTRRFLVSRSFMHTWI